MILTAQGKVIGNLEDGVFRKSVKSKLHLLLMMEAYGIDLAAFEKHLLPINAEIRILEDGAKVYFTSAQHFLSKGVIKDFGHGRQIFLSRKDFETENPKQKPLI